MDQNELPKYTNRLKDNYYNMGTINENIKYGFQVFYDSFLDNHFLNIVFIITIVLIYVYINIYSYYHSFIITFIIYFLFIITVIKFVFKGTNSGFIFGDRTDTTNFYKIISYLALVFAILIVIILKIVFLSLIIDVLIYGRSQLIHYNAKNNYDMDNETKNNFYYYILFSTITSIVLFTCFSLLVFFKNYGAYVQQYETKGYLFTLFILGLVLGMLILEFIYSNYIHNTKKVGNKLYVISQEVMNASTITKPPIDDKMLSYSKYQIPYQYMKPWV